jgi:hypothetical protein
MFRLYEKLKDDATKKVAPSAEELRLAANLPPINAHDAAIIVANLRTASLGIIITDDSLDPAAVVWICLVVQ